MVNEIVIPIPVAVPIPAPAILTVPSLDYIGTFTVSWDSVTNTREYHVQEKAGPEDWTTVAEVTGTDTLIPYRTDGLYLYRVLACNTVGCSDASNEVSTQVVKIGRAHV